MRTARKAASRPRKERTPAALPEGADRLDELRAQWVASGRGGDFDFSEFISGITIIDQLIEREFKRYVVSAFGMSPGDVRILLALRRAPEGALRPTDLFKQLLVTSGAITKQVDRLEARGFVRRVFNSEGKRGWLITLTDRGRNITEMALDSVESMPTMRGAFYALSAAQRSETLQMLHRLVREIQQRTRENPID